MKRVTEGFLWPTTVLLRNYIYLDPRIGMPIQLIALSYLAILIGVPLGGHCSIATPPNNIGKFLLNLVWSWGNKETYQYLYQEDSINWAVEN